MKHPLDNVVWSSLTTAHAPLASGTGLARHYPRDIAPFSAIAEASDSAFRDLAMDLPDGVEARLFRPSLEPLPEGWEHLSVRPILQMVAGKRADLPRLQDIPVNVLGQDDVPAMLDLATATQPGPFGPKTWELGRYVGIREAGRLVAMAGERFRLPGFTEISAICSHPDVRGRGYGLAVTVRLMHDVLERGEQPFLHVFPDNARAVRLYEQLGFTIRRELQVVWARPVSA